MSNNLNIVTIFIQSEVVRYFQTFSGGKAPIDLSCVLIAVFGQKNKNYFHAL